MVSASAHSERASLCAQSWSHSPSVWPARSRRSCVTMASCHATSRCDSEAASAVPQSRSDQGVEIHVRPSLSHGTPALCDRRRSGTPCPAGILGRRWLLRGSRCQPPGIRVPIENERSPAARCSSAQVVPQTLRFCGPHTPGTVCPAPKSIRVRRTAGPRRQAERRRQCLPASEPSPARKALRPRGEGAADAAATMAGTEQGGKADKHDHLHNGFDRRALVVFKSNFRSRCGSGQNAGSGGLSAVQCETTVSE